MENNKENNKSIAAAREEAILEFWKSQDVFNKTLEKKSKEGEFIFYEGPPTANGKPGIHHLEARAFKDAIPRYKTMRGYHVRRKGGWDTHGLPVELQVEKKLGLNSKKAIEEYGIAKFNKECKESVWEYLDIWNKFTKRIGYWVDQENPYVTYHNDYIESVWNVLKQVEDKKLLYKDYKVVPWCPRCGTALSSHELAQGYEDVKDLSVTAKFKIKGVENGYFLAWTTTPWTLPGNVALAVGKDIIYVEAKVGNEILVLAKDRLSIIADQYEIIAEHKGSEMVGMEYEPLYPYLADLDKGDEKLNNAFKVYEADFVNTTDGTGIVHTAVMYGQDDFELGTKIGLPKFHTVDDTGHFIKGTDFLEGRFVKDEEVAIDIIKDLAHRGLLFKKEKYEHSYPHCWRCKTPLIYYARDSWYIRMSDEKIKKQLINENKTINWEPSHIREGRFGEWLKDIKDWAISRERYWGTPLPIWQKADGSFEVIGSLDELKEKTKKSGNKYFIMRHGQATNNIGEIYLVDPDQKYPLTEMGREKALKTAKSFKEKIDVVISSPFDRTKQTAHIFCEQTGFSSDQIIYDTRIQEWKVASEFNDKPRGPMHQYYDYDYVQTPREKFSDGESFAEVVKRAGEFIYDIDSKYSNKNIFIVSHSGFGRALSFVTSGAQFTDLPNRSDITSMLDNAEIRSFEFISLPHNEDYELDFHKPYIDEVKLVGEDGAEMTRVKEVMDVWFDSGAMPFAQDHYPFENKKWVDKEGYPSDYICEAIDQTRGWFYTLHAIGVLTGRGKAYKNVICLGHILDEKGKKMSKSLGNIVDPWLMIEKYGVDTLRLWMYSVNQPGESKNFDEKTVALLQQQVFNLLYNVLAFYELYRDKDLENKEYKNSDNVLDQWIVARLNQLIENSTKQLDNYKLLEPVRELRAFIDELSTWYVRRSRDRLKDGDEDAKRTLYYVLKTLTKVMAPFAPFTSEDIWQKLKNTSDVESVHLAEWPKPEKVNKKIIEDMFILRELCNAGNYRRKQENIPVKQPLNSFAVKKEDGGFAHLIGLDQMLDLAKDELNVKAILFGEEMILDTKITPELKQEGNYRELVRAIQDMRKDAKLTPSDVITLTIGTSKEGEDLINKFKTDLLKTVGAKEIKIYENTGTEIKIDELIFKISIS